MSDIFSSLKRTHNFIITNCDTDSISFVKPDQSEFSEEEVKRLLKELNEEYPEKIKFADDGLFSTVIILKAKNYVLKKHPRYVKKEEDKKPKYKGSALKASTKEPRLKDFIKEIIKEIGTGREDYTTVYNNYVKEIMGITDITKWCNKKTITEKVQTSERTNETKVMDVIENTDYREGDKIYVYYKSDKTLGLRENFDGDYCKDTLLKKLYATAKIFDTILDMSLFPNYALKKNKGLLEEVLK